MTLIQIKMNSGSTMIVEASASCEVCTSEGYRRIDVFDFQCFWPGKGKSREINPKLYDVAGAKATWFNFQRSD